MKNTFKKAFTIVELVIVIAVIAILAAVLIPTFSNLVQKANESTDIQAVRNMNTFLAVEKITDDVDSILDVYDVFDESGFDVKHYNPLYKNRQFYFVKELNQIVYVDDSLNILFPEEHKGKTKEANQNWFSLGMSITKTSEPTSYVTTDSSKVTTEVTTAEEFAYVVEKYDNSKGLEITLKNDIDLMGADISLQEVKGNIIIKSESSDNPVTIKNLTSNKIYGTNSNNNDDVPSAYYAGGLFRRVEVNTNIEIKNVVIEDVHVKDELVGAAGIICGYLSGNSKITLDNVTIKNSSVIGHRDVGAVIGAITSNATCVIKNNLNIENVKVLTIGGRSGKLFGKVSAPADSHVFLKFENSGKINTQNLSLEIYDCKNAEQKFVETGYAAKYNMGPTTKYIESIKGIDGTKAIYGYREDALYLVEKDKWYAVTEMPVSDVSYDNLKNSGKLSN